MALQTNWKDVPNASEPIAAGWYTASIEGVDEKTDSKGRKYFSLQFCVTEVDPNNQDPNEAYVGRYVFSNFGLTEKQMGFGIGLFKALDWGPNYEVLVNDLGEEFADIAREDMEDGLAGRELRIKVNVKEGKGEYAGTFSNNISAYEPL